MNDHIINAIYNGQWAIKEDALLAIIRIAERNAQQPIDPKIFHGAEEKAILPRGGAKIEGTRRSTLHGKVAVLPLVGPIFPRSNIFTDYSGAVNIQSFINDLKFLQDSSDVESIVLNADGPGGYITGIAEAADFIYSTRNIKPIKTYVYGYAASATAWIVTSSSEIVMSPTSEIGSLGVVVAYRSEKEKDAKEGIKNIEIVSSNAPSKRLDMESDEGRAEIQTMVDKLETVFLNAVARNRGTSYENVVKNFGRGGMLIAADAIKIGLADRLGYLTDLIGEMNSEYKSETSIIQTSKGESEMDLTLDKLKAEYREIYQAAFDEGVDHENSRIRNIESINVPGSKKVIDTLKFQKDSTKESICVAIIDEQTKKAADTHTIIKEDGENTAEKIKDLDNDAPTGSNDEEERRILQENMKKGAKTPSK